MQIERLTPEEYSHFLSYGELENDNASQVLSLLNQFLSDEMSDSNDARGLPQGTEDVCSAQRYDCI